MNRFQQTRKVAVSGIIANIFLLISKLTVGFLSGSQAMIADGFNSAGDVFSSAATYAGNRIASHPEDQNHPYGYGKAEYIFSMIISFSLLLIAYKIFRGSLNSIVKKSGFVFSWWLVVIAGLTLLIKTGLFTYTRRVGKRFNSLLILANSEDHRNDIFVTSSTLLGILLTTYGVYWVDGTVGIGISVWIAFTGIRIFLRSYHVLMDTNMDKSLKANILMAILSVDGVEHVDNVVAKPVGVNYIIIAKVSVKGNLTVNESHSIAARIKEKIKMLSSVADVIVHINPS